MSRGLSYQSLLMLGVRDLELLDGLANCSLLIGRIDPTQHLRGRAPEPVDRPGVYSRLRLLAHAADLDISQAESESFVDALARAGNARGMH
jgi:hypothetical protein